MQHEPFVRLAVAEAVDEDVAVDLTGKYIYPFYDGERDKVNGLLIPDLVTADAHTFLVAV